MKKNHPDERELLEMFRRDVEKFPMFSREEERAVAERAARGDTGARNALVKANLRFVFTVVYRNRKPGFPLMEMISEACLGLMRSAETFDPRAGTRFITYAGWWARQGVQRAVGAHVRHGHESLNVPVFAGEDGGESLLDCLPSEEAPRGDVSLAQLERGLKDLSDREKEILRFRYWEDLDMTETGARLGISAEVVRQTEAKALRKARWVLKAAKKF